MFYDEHNPPHFHAEYQGAKAVFDFNGNLLRGNIGSKTTRKLVREWADVHTKELMEDWERARNDERIEPIAPLE